MNIASKGLLGLRTSVPAAKVWHGAVALILMNLIGAVPLCRADTVTAVDDFYTTTENTPLTVPPGGLLSNDTTTNPPLVANLVTGPSHGMFSLSFSDEGPGGWNGGFTYNPGTNFTGMDTLTYDDKDAKGTVSNVATVHIDVIAPVPIPASAWLLLSALGGMGLLVHRRGEQTRQAIRLTRR
jgi:Bacterial Ig domain